MVPTSPFRRVLERAVRERHGSLLEGHERWVLRLLPDDGVRAGLIRAIGARATAVLGVDVALPVLSVPSTSVELRLVRAAQRIADWWWPLVAASLIAAAACAALAGGVRDAVLRIAIAVTGAGVLVAAAVAGLGTYVGAHAAASAGLDDDRERAAVAALWSSLFGDLRTAALVAAAGGIAVAALTAGLPLAAWLEGRARATRRGLSAPGSRARRGGGVLLVAVGVALVLEPALMLRVTAIAAGGLLAAAGIVVLAASVPRAPHARRREAGSARAAAIATAAVVAVTVALVVLVLPAPRGTPQAAASATACNGSAALCGRRLDDVVFPATHNSYAAAQEPGWLFPNQRYGIARQLRDGIRGFLLDVHTGVRDPDTGRVRTDLKADGADRNKVVRELGPDAVRVADRVAGRVGAGGLVGARRPFLCHTLCELGAEPLLDELRVFRRFLDANAREVLILFFEPYVPAAQIERAMTDAGLVDEAARLARNRPLPTLGELVAAGRRLVVLAEKDGGKPPWYLDGFSFVQDTPYQAQGPSDFSCRAFRGERDSPLFLVNHWIATFPPSPTRNERAGGRVLTQRLEQCQRARGRLPNIVAVDFYERSDVVQIARRLNARGP